ncbi:MAG: RtcB family protein [Deltaproteobacteria bacterium]|nr:RtcB family protein [Deltaproteobacteria bacterium]
MISELNGKTVPIKLWTRVEEVESVALDQLRNVASLPWVAHHVAAMPDVHFGKGATVGSVIAMRGAVSPAAVGVDIGCGMAAVKTSLTAKKLPDDLKAIRLALEQAIPVGFASHDTPAWSKVSDDIRTQARELMGRFGQLTSEVQDLERKVGEQLGTLGGGNHFIELCLDTEDNAWLMLHSGSRNIGKTLAEIHMARAKKLDHNRQLPDKDLAVFLAGTAEMKEYRRDLYWAQEYARLNRTVMLYLYKEVLRTFFPRVTFGESVHCHHNYVAEEVHFGEELFITRKGAIRAGEGEMGIIPGSMGTKSYIVRGLGNPESFQSASHGAGRRMSRGKAKQRFTIADLREQTKGVECRKDSGVLDEIPRAYKDIDKVMENQRDLVEIVAELKQVLCVKG